MNQRRSYSTTNSALVVIASLLAFLQCSTVIVHAYPAATVACGGGDGNCDINAQPPIDNKVYGARCCSEEKFPLSKKKEHCNVWAGSKASGECEKRATYDEAVEHCSAAGARLCTKDELLNGCAENTKCKLERRLVWALKVMAQYCNLVRADKWLKEMRLNWYGDDPETAYPGGTPLFDEGTNESTYRYDYLMGKFLPWMVDEFTCDDDDCNLVRADKWLKKKGKNEYGDEPGTVYAGNNPLFNEETNEYIDRYDYLVERFPRLPWMKKDSTCDCNLVRADKWLEKEGLNEYGDEPDIAYLGGTPLFNESTVEYIYRYDYLVEKFLPWMKEKYTCDDKTIYPRCMTDWPSRIGDNICDDVWNTVECGYDGGDCVVSI